MDNVLRRVLKEPKKIMYRLEKSGLIKWLPDEAYIRITYRLAFGRKLDLKNPKAYTEKLNWYKLYYHDPLMKKCADKFEVREYIEKKDWKIVLK